MSRGHKPWGGDGERQDRPQNSGKPRGDRERQGGADGGAKPDGAGPCKAPYHFVPAKGKGLVNDAPVFHDVQQTDEGYWSGELHCTLRALTPLLAANFQYEYRFLEKRFRERFKRLLPSSKTEADVSLAKKVIEPLFTAATAEGIPKEVLIPGEALKGALRQSLGALLSAPMERVQERTLSFRPCLQNAENVRPALVAERKPQAGRLAELRIVEVGKSCSDITYVMPETEAALERFLAGRGHLRQGEKLDDLPRHAPRFAFEGVVVGVQFKSPNDRGKLLPGGKQDLAGYVLARYRGGLDGEKTFARAFGCQMSGGTTWKAGYRWCLVRCVTLGTGQIPPQSTKPVDKGILESYCLLLEHLTDRKRGHLLSHPLKELDVQAVKKNVGCLLKYGPVPGDLIFVERAGGRIVGIGHHYRFRRLYRDSIRWTTDPASSHGKRLRDMLCPAPIEQRVQNGARAGAPERLTAARLLFGYVAQDRMEDEPAAAGEPLALEIGKEDFRQLAGRVSINWAVEAPKEGRQRFLNEGQHYLVPLRPLGEPKPSAVETYLTQEQERLGERDDWGTLCTYGDAREDASAGELRGRKFYLHQPEAADKTKQQFELKPGSPDWESVAQDGSKTYPIVGEQAAIARFVSCAGTEFKFTLRFRDLRSWELGAILFVVTADGSLVERLIAGLKLGPQQNIPERLGTWLARTKTWLDKSPGLPLLALKVGHGRPLGLGSARIDVDRIRRLQFDEGYPSWNAAYEQPGTVDDVRARTIAALADQLRTDLGDKLADWLADVLLPWLQVHRFAGRRSYDYPRGRNGKSPRFSIYEYHSEQRKLHARWRKRTRDRQQTEPPKAGGLISLDDLDKADLEGQHERLK